MDDPDPKLQRDECSFIKSDNDKVPMTFPGTLSTQMSVSLLCRTRWRQYPKSGSLYQTPVGGRGAGATRRNCPTRTVGEGRGDQM